MFMLRAIPGLTFVALQCATAFAQTTHYGVGRPPTAEEIRAWDIAVGPGGKELPQGRGTATEGKAIYQSKCGGCHGATGKEGPYDVLAGGKGTLATATPVKTVGSYWPYATTLWDYVNRAMPFNKPGSLSAHEVYAVTAYVLFLNGIVGPDEVLDNNTLPRIKMPNHDSFEPDPRPDVPRGAKARKNE